MKFKPGQKVSFLNEARNGIIKKIINDKMVSVEIEDGFEVPVMEHELVSAEPYIESTTASATQTKPTTIDEEENSFSDRAVLNFSERSELKKGLYITYIPENPNKPLQDGLYVCLINYTPYDIIFTYSLKKDNKYIHYAFDRATSNSRVLLEFIDATDIQIWSSLKFNIIYYKENSSDSINPQTCFTHINPIKFYKDESYKTEPLIDSISITIPLSENISEPANEPILIEKPKGIKIVGHINDIINKDSFPEKYIVSKGIAEVDLHIDELLENIEGLNNSQMLITQISFFRKMLENAIANHLQRIIFIHGVGNGKLKTEIRQILKDEYPNLEIYDASMAKYGVGATEIKIPHNL